MIIDELLEIVMQKGASDLHLSSNSVPIARIDGSLYPVTEDVLSAIEIENMIFQMLSNDLRRNLEQNWELDFSYGVENLGRFRVNVYKDRGNYAAAFRTINSVVPNMESLNLHPTVKKMCETPRGLILVTGPTGSGKSTTLASMIDYINRNKAEHILTIEDPIEFIHQSKRSLVHQRELGQDTRSFANALRSALREDPDIILVGELRDLETISLAMTAAETGHLVFATLHTSSAIQTVDRIIDAFPEGAQQQIRMQLSNSLVAVFAQTLLPKLAPDGITKKGRVLAQEVMIINNAIANLIREGKTAQIYSVLQTSINAGMQTLDHALNQLYVQKKITADDALLKSSRPEELKRLMGI